MTVQVPRTKAHRLTLTSGSGDERHDEETVKISPSLSDPKGRSRFPKCGLEEIKRDRIERNAAIKDAR